MIWYRVAWFLKQILYIYILYSHVIDLPRCLNASLNQNYQALHMIHKFATNKPQEMIRHWQRYCWGLVQLCGPENSGLKLKTPQIIHGLIGFSMIFTIHCWGTSIFGNTHLWNVDRLEAWVCQTLYTYRIDMLENRYDYFIATCFSTWALRMSGTDHSKNLQNLFLMFFCPSYQLLFPQSLLALMAKKQRVPLKNCGHRSKWPLWDHRWQTLRRH